ncbi:odorant receptor Or1-like [Leptopilina heterotoma]|uniref:odorant receptor Or1-like n=1 Tax=Leptopilina heterotoma TaxID=63436 RepID=UPI001CA8F263|nr:odorant receptor Or1-like [Leptopilina heterotoma]
MFRGNKILEFFQRLHQPIFAPKQQEHHFLLKKYEFIAKASNVVFLTMCLFTITLWCIIPFVEKSQKNQLLYVAWYPYDTTKNPRYFITYISQAFLLYRTASVNAMIDTMITNFYVIMMGQIEILKQDLKNLADIVNQKENIVNDCIEESLEELLNRRIIKSTEHYKEILKYIHDVTNFFEVGIVTQVCASTIVICTSTYQMTLVSLLFRQMFLYNLAWNIQVRF